MLGGDIEYVGELGSTEKRDLLCGAAALLNPIDWPEPFGMVMLEALACGTPLVITDVGGAREVVRHRDAGRIVARDTAAIAAAIAELLASPPERQSVAATVADYSWTRNGAALIEHWRALIG